MICFTSNIVIYSSIVIAKFCSPINRLLGVGNADIEHMANGELNYDIEFKKYFKSFNL